MQVLEKVIEKKVVNWAKKNGIKVKKKVFGEELDRWFMFPWPHMVIVEFKRKGKKPTPRQQKEINELRELGYDVQVFDESEAAISYLERKRKLVAETLSKEGAKVSTAASVRGFVPRPWVRKN